MATAVKGIKYGHKKLGIHNDQSTIQCHGTNSTK